MIGKPGVSRLLALEPARTEETELLDRPGHDRSLLTENLRDLCQVNRFLGGVRLTIGALNYLCDGVSSGAWLLSHMFTRNRLTRHDAPLSVRRAYTIPEMVALATASGTRVVRVDGFLAYRVALILGRPE